ncbi:unnamed protein product [Nesidiocoris tenuis]|uniref:Uncharacterized protein n=1 Tax=Nesidiocoris tenuis TaxID=355587 RepID=A0A6H5H2L2_9HEMI|nr:unnamed protein product [Nesidiocoris tenuis]
MVASEPGECNNNTTSSGEQQQPPPAAVTGSSDRPQPPPLAAAVSGVPASASEGPSEGLTPTPSPASAEELALLAKLEEANRERRRGTGEFVQCDESLQPPRSRGWLLPRIRLHRRASSNVELPQRADSDPEAVMNLAYNVKFSTKRMQKLKKEYTVMKTKEQEDMVELRRLRQENRLLKQRVELLEAESSELAQRLVRGQVSRAEEEETTFVVQRELQALRMVHLQTSHQLEVAQEEIRNLSLVIEENVSDALTSKTIFQSPSSEMMMFSPRKHHDSVTDSSRQGLERFTIFSKKKVFKIVFNLSATFPSAAFNILILLAAKFESKLAGRDRRQKRAALPERGDGQMPPRGTFQSPPSRSGKRRDHSRPQIENARLGADLEIESGQSSVFAHQANGIGRYGKRTRQRRRPSH